MLKNFSEEQSETASWVDVNDDHRQDTIHYNEFLETEMGQT